MKRPPTLGEDLGREAVAEFGRALDRGEVSLENVERPIKRVLGRPEVCGKDPYLDLYARLVAVVFCGLPDDFDPKALLRMVNDKSLFDFINVLNERNDGNDGPWQWWRAEWAWRKGLCTRDWQFERQATASKHSGRCTVFLKIEGRETAVVGNMSFGP